MRYIIFIYLFLGSIFADQKTKVLHITFHKGCAGEIDFLAKHFGFELDTWLLLEQPTGFFDPLTRGKDNYMMSHDKAARIFNKHKDTFDQYDLIITSDIGPLSRVFLQNNWEKPLLIWICNRFDLNVRGRHFKGFPDEEYLQMFDQAQNKLNIEIVGYTRYEKRHAILNRGITSIERIIPPTGKNESIVSGRQVSPKIDKASHFFVRNYINETYGEVLSHLRRKGIKSYCGQYAGSSDLKDFKGMVHIPCVMANFHLWENINQGLIHFIPSKKFYKELYEAEVIQFWDWTVPAKRGGNLPIVEIFEYCDWYNPELAHLFEFFDSYDHLKQLIAQINYDERRDEIKAFSKKHVEYCLEKWRQVFDRLLHP